jgi:hypothetical protein
LTILHLSHIFLTEALTFIVTVLQKYSESTGAYKLPILDC